MIPPSPGHLEDGGCQLTWGVLAFSTLDYLMLHNKVCSLKMSVFPLLRSLLPFAVDETIGYLQWSDDYSKT